jgi:hypothetical protein
VDGREFLVGDFARFDDFEVIQLAAGKNPDPFAPNCVARWNSGVSGIQGY